MKSPDEDQPVDDDVEVVLVCDDKHFIISRSSLLSLGGKYRELIEKSQTKDEIVLPNVSSETLEVVLKFTNRSYGNYDFSSLNIEVLLHLYEHSLFMELSDFTTLLRKEIENKTLTDSTALYLRDLAIREVDWTLHLKALEFLVYRWKYLFHCEKLLKVSLDEFQCIIDIALEKKAHTHFFILNRILEWIKYDFLNRKAYTEKLIDKINFQNIPKYFSNHVLRTEEPVKQYLKKYINPAVTEENSTDIELRGIAVIVCTGESELHISEEGGKLLPLSKTPFKINHVSVLLPLDQYLVILQGKGDSNTLLKFDFLTALWTDFPMPFPLRQMKAAKVGEFIYVLGKAMDGYNLVRFNHHRNNWENGAVAHLPSTELDSEQHFLLALNEILYIIIDREKLPRTEPSQGIVECYRFDQTTAAFLHEANVEREGYGCDEAFVLGKVIVLRLEDRWLQFDPTTEERFRPIQLELPNHARHFCSVTGKEVVFAVQDGEKKLFLTVHQPLQSKRRNLEEIKKGKKCFPHLVAFHCDML